jgi:hypothetical protein
MKITSQSPTASANHGGLDLRIAARGSSALVTLHNGGPNALKVLSHVDATRRHYDWLTITLEGDGDRRSLHLYDDRNESHRVIVDLAPGQEVEHVIDVVAWAQRKPNGARPLAPGTYRMWASYEVTEPGDVWTGKLVSPTVAITIP